MDVYKEDFEELLPQIEFAIADCDFCALDFEMSGISVPDKTLGNNYGDTPQERYAKMRHVVKQYSIIQLGLCLFAKEEGTGGRRITKAMPYNMFAFPASGTDVMLSVDAITFLRGQGMDFQKWIYRGVSFVDGVREQSLLEQLERDREWDRKEAAGESRDGNTIKINKSADKKWLKMEIDRIEKWLGRFDAAAAAAAAVVVADGDGGAASKPSGGQEEAKGGGREQGHAAATEDVVVVVVDDGDDEVEEVKNFVQVGKVNSFLRRALREAVQDKWPDLVIETRGGNLVVMKLTEEEKAERAKARDDERLAKLNAVVGLRRVFKAMCAAKKPLVVHNGMYDLMFLFASLHGPLPELLKDFKKELKAAYPGAIYDTKYVASREDLHRVSLGDTTVEGLYEALVKSERWNKVALSEGFEKYDTSKEESSSFAHEAGYDAYLTGTIFARFRDDLLEMYHCKELQNRIYNFRSLFDINLDSEDQLAHKGHVFHVHITPAGRSLKTDDLMKLFGENSHHVYILWINESGAFAVVDKCLEFDNVLKGMVLRAEVKVTPFEAWWAVKKAKEDAHERALAGAPPLGLLTTTTGGTSTFSGWLVDVLKRPWGLFTTTTTTAATSGQGGGVPATMSVGGGTTGGQQPNGEVSPGTQRGMKKPRTQT